jgi:FtsH-binding integral membrane protein
MDFPISIPDQAAARQTSAMTQVYGWMTAGLAVTGAVAALTLRSQATLDFIYGNIVVYWGLLLLELVGVFVLSSAIYRLSSGVATFLFLGFAALNGLTLAGIFLYYTGASIASTFFITAGTFAAMSFYGTTTKRDLSSFGSIAYMALIGLILATVVNFFLHSAAIYWITTYLGVAVFVVLTAADTQRIRAMMARAEGMGTRNVAILGALTLYLDFINLFLYLLRIFGQGQSSSTQSS